MVTIREVARQAGVSVATVSRVLNSSGPVRVETRRRVLDAVEELGYVPHGGARSLITRRTHVLGAVLPDLHGEFFSEVIRGMDRAAQRAGYHLFLSSSHDDRGEIEWALRAMSGRIDGLILMSPLVPARDLAPSIPKGVRVVLVNCEVEDELPFDSLNTDNYGGAYRLIQHLTSLGHERIAFIGGVPENHDAQERLRGYRDGLQASALEWRADYEVIGEFSKVGGHRAAGAFLKCVPRPTAIFAANDSMAFGAMSALHAAGLRVPEDMALAGFDDVPLARYWNPPLTSVHVDLKGIGASAVTMLLGALSGDEERARRRRLVETTLAVRRSCGGNGWARLGAAGDP